jgi:glycosyltransferase involved in cell wall biosynthesis
MRVLLVVHGFPPVAVGGTEIYVHDLARSLAADFGDQVWVLARESDPLQPEYGLRRESRAGMEVVYLNNTFRSCRSFEQTYRNAEIRRVVGALLEEVRPQVAHVHHLTCLSTDLVDEMDERGIPVVVTLNDYWLLCQRGQLLDLEYGRCAGPTPEGCARCLHTEPAQAAARLAHVRETCQRVTQFLAPSRTLRERFVALGVDSRRLTLATQGIDHAPLRATVRAASGGPLRLGFLGTVMVSKAPHVLLEAFAHLPAGAATLRLYGGYTAYHGDDTYRQRMAPLLSLPGVESAGPISHDDVPQALAGLDVLVVPSVWIENAPFVIKEAFVAGLPVVTSDLGGMAELVQDGRGGLLFRAGDSRDLARVLQRLLAEPLLLPRLRESIPSVTTIQEDARWTREQYARHLPARPALASEKPEHGDMAAGR